MKLKRFEEINERLDIDQDFEGQKAEILSKLDEFMHDYEVLSIAVSPKHYRTTGSHFTELRKMQREIAEFTHILPTERENKWVKKDLDETEKRLRGQ